jgi:hypothetical protein
MMMMMMNITMSAWLDKPPPWPVPPFSLLSRCSFELQLRMFLALYGAA